MTTQTTSTATGAMATEPTKVKTLRRVTRTLLAWRHLELSYSVSVRPPWNLTWSGSTKRLPCGAADLQFFSLAAVARYLAPFGFAVEDTEGITRGRPL